MNALAGIVAMVITCTGSAMQGVDEPDSYKLDNYQSATPDTLQGATVIGAIQANQLLKQDKVLFIDVLPAQKKPAQLNQTELWLPRSRLNIPGSTWLPDIGYGVLSDELENYFVSNLKTLTDIQPEKGLVFYCNKNCWMSWNAARRAVEFGYQHVYWFPGGVDEWAAAGFELSESIPVPTAVQ